MDYEKTKQDWEALPSETKQELIIQIDAIVNENMTEVEPGFRGAVFPDVQNAALEAGLDGDMFTYIMDISHGTRYIYGIIHIHYLSEYEQHHEITWPEYAEMNGWSEPKSEYDSLET